MNKQKIRVKQLREWLKYPQEGVTITYIQGHTKSYSWGTTPDRITDELDGYTENQFVTVSLENTKELQERDARIERERVQELATQQRLKAIFKPTKTRTEVTGNNIMKNYYTIRIDEVNKIQRTDWNGITGKLTQYE